MRYLKNGILTFLGIFLILLGIVGLFLPFVQGILLILLGASLLSAGSEKGKEALRKIKERFRRK